MYPCTLAELSAHLTFALRFSTPHACVCIRQRCEPAVPVAHSFRTSTALFTDQIRPLHRILKRPRRFEMPSLSQKEPAHENRAVSVSVDGRASGG
jgi:hypothetical protein